MAPLDLYTTQGEFERVLSNAGVTLRGAKTKVEVLGGRQVEILRDTGVLFNSLSPGREDQPYNGPEATQQVHDVKGG